jgi:hypothetical protein
MKGKLMGNLFDEIGTCYNCYDEGVLFFGNGSEEYDTEFCGECAKGQELENYYIEWYAQNEMNEYTKENA